MLAGQTIEEGRIGELVETVPKDERSEVEVVPGVSNTRGSEVKGGGKEGCGFGALGFLGAVGFGTGFS